MYYNILPFSSVVKFRHVHNHVN